ncbi:MAG TPA: hypothetical protein VGB43_06790 [Flavobacterium sp.]|jgi:hypothetical protein
MKTSKSGNQNPRGQILNDGQKHYQHSNERNPDHVRDNTRKNQYQDYDQKLTNDENYDLNNPDGTDQKMDFRDKLNNLEDQ